MKIFSLVFIVAFLLMSCTSAASDGDSISIKSQTPNSGYEAEWGIPEIGLGFSFSGDIANCSLYGDWGDGWGIKNSSLVMVFPSEYSFSVPISDLVCDEVNKWNVYCVEDNNSANSGWGNNLTFTYKCEEAVIETHQPKTYHFLITQPWSIETYPGDRFIFQYNGSYYNFLIRNIIEEKLLVTLLPSYYNFSLGFTNNQADIDLDGDKTKDITIKMGLLFAQTKAMITFSKYGYNENVSADNATEEENKAVQNNVTANITNTTTNTTLNNNTQENKKIQNATSQSFDEPGVNQTNKINSSIGEASEGNNDIQNPANAETNDDNKGEFPLWIILLIFLILGIVIVYLSIKVMSPVAP